MAGYDAAQIMSFLAEAERSEGSSSDEDTWTELVRLVNALLQQSKEDRARALQSWVKPGKRRDRLENASLSFKFDTAPNAWSGISLTDPDAVAARLIQLFTPGLVRVIPPSVADRLPPPK